jgi:hypothetical protein
MRVSDYPQMRDIRITLRAIPVVFHGESGEGIRLTRALSWLVWLLSGTKLHRRLHEHNSRTEPIDGGYERSRTLTPSNGT